MTRLETLYVEMSPKESSSVFKECFVRDFFSVLIFVGGYQRPITGSEEKIRQTTGQTYLPRTTILSSNLITL